MYRLNKGPTFIWSPKEDITAFELANCMTMMIASGQRHASEIWLVKTFDTLPEEAKRHFRKIEE